MGNLEWLLRQLIVLLLCTQSIDAFVYSCEEVRYRIINTDFSKNTTYVCVVAQLDFNNWNELSKIYVQDDKVSTSFESIANSFSKCLSNPRKSWTIVGEDSMDCSQEFSLIFTSDKPEFYTPFAEDYDASFTLPIHVFVVPQISMWLHITACNGEDNITIYTGAGSDESEERYFMNSWTCDTLPKWIISFDNVITIDQHPNMRLNFHSSSTLYSRDRPAQISPGDRIAVLASGRSDNLQARPIKGSDSYNNDDYKVYFEFVYKNNYVFANVSMSSQLTWDMDKFPMTSQVSILYGKTGISETGSGQHVENFYTDSFWVSYEPVVRKANEIWNSEDNVIIEMSTFIDDTISTTVKPITTVKTTTRPPTTVTSTRMTTVTTAKTTQTVTTTRTVPTTQTTTPPKPAGQDPYCNCGVDKFGFAAGWEYNDIWLDIVVILDTSEAMGAEALRDAGALIESFISDGFDDFLITNTAASLYTRVGVISMSDTAQVLYNLNMTKNDKVQDKVAIKKGVSEMNVADAFDAATQMFSDGLKSKPDRSNTRQVIYYMTDSKPGDNLDAINQFKTSNGVVIVNNFLQEEGVDQPGLRDLASDGYYFPYSNYMQALQAFCKANCFCRSDLDTYGGTDPAIKAAGGCYHPTSAGVPFNKAKTTCSSEGGIIATDHSVEKGRFLKELMTNAAPKSDFFWIGYEKSDDGVWRWEDQSSDPYTNWDVNEPSSASVAKCAYVDQSQANLPWGAGNCQLGFPYVCEYTPCSVGDKNC